MPPGALYSTGHGRLEGQWVLLNPMEMAVDPEVKWQGQLGMRVEELMRTLVIHQWRLAYWKFVYFRESLSKWHYFNSTISSGVL